MRSRDPLDDFSLISIVVKLGFVLVLAFVLLSFVGLDAPRGESTYSGQVVDFENERGLIFQTSQAHVKTNPESSSSEVFCVHPDNRSEQVDVLREAASNGDRVTVTYSRPYFVPPWECESGTSIIRDVEVHSQ